MRYFTYAIIVVVCLAVIAGFFVAGSPAEQRRRDFDAQRVSDLQSIQSYVVEYWRSKEVLPNDLAVLNDDLRGIRIPSDPETEVAYQYSIKGPLSFALCGEFRYPSASGSSDYVPDVFNTWHHPDGLFCFDRTIDPDFFDERAPLLEKPVRPY